MPGSLSFQSVMTPSWKKSPTKRLYSCCFCDYKSPHISLVVGKHLDMHNRKERFTCPSCTYSAKQKRFVDVHFAKDHSPSQDGSSVESLEKSIHEAEDEVADSSFKIEYIQQRKLALDEDAELGSELSPAKKKKMRASLRKEEKELEESLRSAAESRLGSLRTLKTLKRSSL